MNSLEIGAAVRIPEAECIGQEDRIACGIIVEIRQRHTNEFEYKVWWDDGFEPNWFLAEELEETRYSKLSLPFFGDA